MADKSPQWHQESSNKNLQPFQIPEFEVAGNQTDHENHDRAVKLVVTRTSLVALVLFGFSLFFILDDFEETHSNFAQFNTESSTATRTDLRLIVHSVERKDKLEGLLFDTNAQPGFSFIVVDISITNRHRSEPFNLSIYSIKIVTSDEVIYSTDLQTRSFKGGISNGTVDPGETIRGFLVFRLPSSKGLNRMEIRGFQGSLASSPF